MAYSQPIRNFSFVAAISSNEVIKQLYCGWHAMAAWLACRRSTAITNPIEMAGNQRRMAYTTMAKPAATTSREANTGVTFWPYAVAYSIQTIQSD